MFHFPTRYQQYIIIYRIIYSRELQSNTCCFCCV